MQTLAMSLVIAREDGRLKRGRGTPMPRLGLHRRPDRQLDRRRAADAGAARRRSAASSTASRSPGRSCPSSLVVLVVGAASFCCLGIALTAAIPSQDAAAPIVNALLLPLYFLSGVFIPDDQLPSGVIHFADLFPVRHFFEAFFDAYVPAGGARISWDNLAVVAAWGVGRPAARDPLLPLDPPRRVAVSGTGAVARIASAADAPPRPARGLRPRPQRGVLRRAARAARLAAPFRGGRDDRLGHRQAGLLHLRPPRAEARASACSASPGSGSSPSRRPGRRASQPAAPASASPASAARTAPAPTRHSSRTRTGTRSRSRSASD